MARFPTFSLGGRERSILDGVQEHLATARECVVAFQKLIPACAVHDPGVSELLGIVFELEERADAIQRDMSRRIAEGAFFGGVREDILDLISNNDSIADAAKDAARLLVIGEEYAAPFKAFLSSEHMGRFQQNLLGAVDSLASVIGALDLNKEVALSRVPAIEQCEENADTEKDYLLRELFSMRNTLDAVSIIQLRDFLFASDDIADNAENSGDAVVVLVAKGYG